MSVNLLLIYLISATLTYALDYETFVFDTYRDVCPFSKTCTQPAKLDFTSDRQQYVPCCFPCSCEENICLETKSCCPDLGNSSVLNEKRRYTECLPTIYPADHQHKKPFHKTSKSYSTIRTCPTTFPQEDIVSRCTRLSPKTLDELVFVSDDYGNIYRNRDCALCNGVETFTRWKLIIQCIDQFEQFQNKLSLYIVRKSGCTIWSEAPSLGQLLEKRRCYLADFDTCNVTGLWEAYDENIVKACRGEQFGPFKINGNLYKNVFCYICNGGRVRNNLCRPDTIKLLTIPFTALVDFRSVSRRKDSSSRCKINKIYDKYVDKCRYLMCPVNTVSSYGKCLKLFQITDGFTVNFGLFLTSSTSFPDSSREIGFVLKTAVFALNSKIKKFNEKCHLCSINVLTEPEMKRPTLSARIALATSPKCPESNISAMAKSLDQISIVINIINKQSYTFNTHLVGQRYNNFSDVTPGHPHYLYSPDSCVLTEVHLTDVQCPRVTITGTDYTMALKNNFIKPNDYYNKNLIDKDDWSLSNIEFDICVDEYFGSNGVGSVKQTTTFTSNMAGFRNSWTLSLLTHLAATSIQTKLLF